MSIKIISTFNKEYILCNINPSNDQYHITIEYKNRTFIDYTTDTHVNERSDTSFINSFNLKEYIESLDNSLFSTELKSCIKIIEEIYDNTKISELNNVFVCLISFIIYKIRNSKSFYSNYYYLHNTDNNNKYYISDSVRSTNIDKDEINILRIIEKLIKKL